MAILEYIPPLKKIIDKRNPTGDYYKAECDVCGTEFYPKRRSAKYCTPNCKVIQHRIDVANGKVTKTNKVESKILVSNSNIKLKGIKSAYNYIKSKYNIHGDRDYILNGLKNTEIGSEFEYGELKIYKNSVTIYSAKK
jgi:hypothetical protein